jgi:hypothetical protein
VFCQAQNTKNMGFIQKRFKEGKYFPGDGILLGRFS